MASSGEWDTHALLSYLIIVAILVIFGLGVGWGKWLSSVKEDDRFVLIFNQTEVAIYRDSVTGLCYAKGAINGPVACGESDERINIVEPAKAESR